nr:MAG TPA: hypothetical protein [Caudoviricetes sp.]
MTTCRHMAYPFSVCKDNNKQASKQSIDVNFS